MYTLSNDGAKKFLPNDEIKLYLYNDCYTFYLPNDGNKFSIIFFNFPHFPLMLFNLKSNDDVKFSLILFIFVNVKIQIKKGKIQIKSFFICILK